MEEGGGASLTTDPAAGSSAATDVSLREHFSALRESDRELARERLARVFERADLMRGADKEAVDKALDAARELAEKHNDLIRAGEKKDATYATKDDVNRLEKWQSKITGGMILLGALGVANLVKLWT